MQRSKQAGAATLRVGDQLAELAVKNGWAGILVYGCIRDSKAIGEMDLGVFALGAIRDGGVRLVEIALRQVRLCEEVGPERLLRRERWGC